MMLNEQIEMKLLRVGFMKKWLINAAIACIFALSLASCSSSIQNSISFNNQTQGALYINFRGQLITVPAGQTSKVEKIRQGTYDYATTFSVPTTASSASSQGALTGSFTLNADTKILLYYTSTLINGAYTVYVTISNSDNKTTGTTNP